MGGGGGGGGVSHYVNVLSLIPHRPPTICSQNVLEVHNTVLRRCIRSHRGYEVKTEGDAFMCAFQDASDGVAFALDVQGSLADAAWPDALLVEHPEPALRAVAGLSDGWRGIRVRIGLHTGSCLSTPNPVTNRMD